MMAQKMTVLHNTCTLAPPITNGGELEDKYTRKEQSPKQNQTQTVNGNNKNRWVDVNA